MCFWFHEIDLELKATIELLRNINRNIFVQTKSQQHCNYGNMGSFLPFAKPLISARLRISLQRRRQRETWKAPQSPPTPHIVTEPLGLLNGCQSKVLPFSLQGEWQQRRDRGLIHDSNVHCAVIANQPVQLKIESDTQGSPFVCIPSKATEADPLLSLW